MKYSIAIVTGLLTLSFFGCSTQSPPKQKKQPVIKKSKVKTSPSKVKTPQKKEQKIIDDYQSTIYENIAKSKEKKKKLEILELKKESLLKDMEIARVQFAKDQDKNSFIKKRDAITKKLNKIQKEYDALKSQNEIVNYSQELREKK